MPSPTNDAFLRFTRRAEQNDRSKLVETFVDSGNLFTLLSSNDHQILYGRRGTGKTHALSYLEDKRLEQGDVVAYIDLRNIGSNAGIYSDSSIDITERASRLLIDVFSQVHSVLYEIAVTKAEEIDLSSAGPALDSLADSLSEIRVSGPIEQKSGEHSQSATENNVAGKIGISGGATAIEASAGSGTKSLRENTKEVIVRGSVQHVIHFGGLNQAITRYVALLKGKRFWLLLDEWSAIPIELQPYLADLLRRSIFSVKGVTVKIAAIEHRSNFRAMKSAGDYLGIELGADAAADMNLDDFMVFDNNEARAKGFFKEFIYKHYRSIVGEDPKALTDADKLIQESFTQKNAFEEFVKASEGVPRDAINILSIAAQRAINEQISVPHIRSASKTWYDRDKGAAVNSNPESGDLLNWIIDEVIAGRKARAFLLQTNTRHPLIDSLFDARVLHILKRSIASKEQAGERYDVYKLDFGCYVDLIATAKSPQGLLPFDDAPDGAPANDTHAGFVEVPPDDYRSIRRAILDLAAFERRLKK